MWRVQQQGKTSKDAPDYYKRMRAMGIVVLPELANHIKAGETDLVPMMSDLTGAVAKDATIRQVLEWWTANEKAWTVPMPCKE
jgi:hypothetical protein